MCTAKYIYGGGLKTRKKLSHPAKHCERNVPSCRFEFRSSEGKHTKKWSTTLSGLYHYSQFSLIFFCVRFQSWDPGPWQISQLLLLGKGELLSHNNQIFKRKPPKNKTLVLFCHTRGGGGITRPEKIKNAYIMRKLFRKKTKIRKIDPKSKIYKEQHLERKNILNVRCQNYNIMSNGCLYFRQNRTQKLQ